MVDHLVITANALALRNLRELWSMRSYFHCWFPRAQRRVYIRVLGRLCNRPFPEELAFLSICPT